MKRWLLEHFLPMWAKETVLKDNRQLHRQVRHLQQKIRQQQAYIRGLELGLRAVKKGFSWRRSCHGDSHD